MRPFTSALVLIFLVIAHAAEAEELRPGSPDFDRIPAGLLTQMFDATKSTGYTGLGWTVAPGQVRTVKVAFNGGSPQARLLIEQTANEWTANGGRLRLSFRLANGAWRTWNTTDTQPKADIRIGFFSDPQRRGYWSAVGTLALRAYPNTPTMNYDKLGTTLAMFDPVARPKQWQDSYSRTVILHEFGHALGLNHEHFHPTCQADLKLNEAIQSLTGPPNNWSLDQARFNMDGPYYVQQMAAATGGLLPSTSPTCDRASVMLYSFNDNLYRSGKDSPCRPSGPLGYATGLSAQDRAYFASVYGSGS